jgi:hypothetical protein
MMTRSQKVKYLRAHGWSWKYQGVITFDTNGRDNYTAIHINRWEHPYRPGISLTRDEAVRLEESYRRRIAKVVAYHKRLFNEHNQRTDPRA